MWYLAIFEGGCHSKMVPIPSALFAPTLLAARVIPFEHKEVGGTEKNRIIAPFNPQVFFSLSSRDFIKNDDWQEITKCERKSEIRELVTT